MDRKKILGFVFTGLLAAGGAVISQLMTNKEIDERVNKALNEQKNESEEA